MGGKANFRRQAIRTLDTHVRQHCTTTNTGRQIGHCDIRQATVTYNKPHTLPHNIATADKPPKEEVNATHQSHFPHRSSTQHNN